MEPKLTARGKDVGQLRPPPTGALVKGDLGIMGPQAKGFQEPEGSLPTHLHRYWPLGRITHPNVSPGWYGCSMTEASPKG